MKNLSIALEAIRGMVNDFVCNHHIEWDKIRFADQQKQVEAWRQRYPNDTIYQGCPTGRSLSMQSHISSDLLIDFVSLASASDSHIPFIREIWIRSYGTQSIDSVSDVKVNRGIWNDVLAKILIIYNGVEFTTIEWFQDEDCRINNKLIVDDSLAKSLSHSNSIND
jgi:hypothetical protein